MLLLTIASCLNLCIVRYNELEEGISVSLALPNQNMSINYNNNMDAATKNGNNNHTYEFNIDLDIGKSKCAGQDALVKCCMARVVWSVPPMFFPPMIMKQVFMKRKWFMKLGFWGKLSVEAALIGLTVMTFIPPSMALFPQKDTIPGHRLEKHLLERAKEITQLDESVLKDMPFSYNKGL